METKKHIINLPKNKVAENISVKTENGQIIVNYDLKEEFNPKDGDFLVSSLGSIFIYNSYNVDSNICASYCGTYPSDILRYTFSNNWANKEGCRYATEFEKQAFLERLKDAGYTWNAEKMCLEKYVWRPKIDEKYYWIGPNMKVYSLTYSNSAFDNNMISINNDFQTKEQAEKKAEELREVLKKK